MSVCLSDCPVLSKSNYVFSQFIFNFPRSLNGLTADNLFVSTFEKRRESLKFRVLIFRALYARYKIGYKPSMSLTYCQRAGLLLSPSVMAAVMSGVNTPDMEPKPLE